MTDAGRWKAHLVIGFSDLDIEDKIDAVCTCLDDLIEQARAGKVSRVAAKQITMRTDRIFENVVLPGIKGAA